MHKVDILWKDISNKSISQMGVSGELYVRVFMSETCDRSRFWAVLMGDCLQLMDLIDWKRSYPEDIHAAASAFGIDFAKTQFLSVSSLHVRLGCICMPSLLIYLKENSHLFRPVSFFSSCCNGIVFT